VNCRCIVEYCRRCAWVRSDRSLSERGVIETFNIDQKSSRELRQYLCSVALQYSPSTATVHSCSSGMFAATDECFKTPHVDCPAPAVIILDDLHHVGSPALLADAFNALLGLPLHHW